MSAAPISFAPNQLAANRWYRPDDPSRPVNGHLDPGFGAPERWPRLRRALQGGGAFGVFAAEIGHLSTTDGLLPLLKRSQVRVSVETPGFTQPIDGARLAEMELLGRRVDGVNHFARTFRIEKPDDRPDPDGRGWFVTRDGAPMVPDEIAFDERIPNLLPTFDARVLTTGSGDWSARKDAARRADPIAAARGPFARLLASLMDDYVRYLEVARRHWKDRMPAVALHWNVTPGWEWRDEAGLDAIQAADPALQTHPDTWHRDVFARARYGSVGYLERLVRVLAEAGFRPRVVYMDVDWTYDIPYVLEALRRHRRSLARLGVAMGINVVEASLGPQEALAFADGTLRRRSDPDTDPNVLYADTLVAIAQLLKAHGLTGKEVHLRVGSWSRRPAETGAQVDERRPGSLAHAALRVLDRL